MLDTLRPFRPAPLGNAHAPGRLHGDRPTADPLETMLREGRRRSIYLGTRVGGLPSMLIVGVLSNATAAGVAPHTHRAFNEAVSQGGNDGSDVV